MTDFVRKYGVCVADDWFFFFFFQAEDGIRDVAVTGVQTCALPICPRVFGHDRSMPFLGREFSSEPDYSDEIAREIDDEIRRIVEEAHQTAKDILVERREDLDRISKLLLERETIDAAQFVKLLDGVPAE